MIIDGIKIAKVDIVDPNDKILVTLEDEGVTKLDGYKVNVLLDKRPGPNAIAMPGDVLYYEDDENTKYLVTEADEKFFTMVPAIVDRDKEEVSYDYQHARTYPNHRSIGKLKDFRLVLEYRSAYDKDEEDENDKKKKQPNGTQD